jgi:signal transduction histidine kinase
MLALLASVHGIFASAALAAGERGTEEEAQAMVGNAIALIKVVGPENAYKKINENPGVTFKDRDLFLFIYDFQGNMLAQAANPKMVGKNLIDLKDVDGVPLAKGVIDMVKAKKKGWFGPYRFANPNTQAYEYKKTYCEQASANTLACAGVYIGNKAQ